MRSEKYRVDNKSNAPLENVLKPETMLQRYEYVMNQYQYGHYSKSQF